MSETNAAVCPVCRTWFELSGRGPRCPACGWRAPGFSRITGRTILALTVGLGLGIGALYLAFTEDNPLFGQIGVLFLTVGVIALTKVIVAIMVPRPIRRPVGNDGGSGYVADSTAFSADSPEFDLGEMGGGDGGGGGGGD